MQSELEKAEEHITAKAYAPKVDTLGAMGEPRHIEAGKSSKAEEKRLQIPDGAALTQEEESFAAASGTTTQVGVDEKNRNAEKLSKEEEELYYRLFPEDREIESRAAVSALEVSGKKAFHIRVPVSGGKRLCLTEDNHGYEVRAEPCRRNSHRQKWYWVGSKLKNLYSKGRCLGWALHKHHVSTQASPRDVASFVEQSGEGNRLSMSFRCADAQAPLRWRVDA